MQETPGARAAAIVRLCQQEGFALAGVTPLRPNARAEEFRAWLAAGKHGEMEWLAETVAERLDPLRVLPGASSAVMVADVYAPRGTPADATVRGVGRIARYARGRDYHDVLKRRVQRVCDRVREMYPGEAMRAFCDTAPVPERELAAQCGLGWIGKHTLVIHPVHGSWMLLGGFLTTLELEPAERQVTVSDHCGTCTRCIDACPTEAIRPYSVDARRCISYLTIEHQGLVETELAERIGDWLIGCDICQEVCPHNSPRPSGAESGGGVSARPEYLPRRDGFELLDVLGWDEPTRRARFATSAMKRVTLAQLKRNAILVLVSVLQSRVREHAGGASNQDEDLRRTAINRLRDLAWKATEPETMRSAAKEAARTLAAASP